MLYEVITLRVRQDREVDAVTDLSMMAGTFTFRYLLSESFTAHVPPLIISQ